MPIYDVIISISNTVSYKVVLSASSVLPGVAFAGELVVWHLLPSLLLNSHNLLREAWNPFVREKSCSSFHSHSKIRLKCKAPGRGAQPAYILTKAESFWEQIWAKMKVIQTSAGWYTSKLQALPLPQRHQVNNNIWILYRYTQRHLKREEA